MHSIAYGRYHETRGTAIATSTSLRLLVNSFRTHLDAIPDYFSSSDALKSVDSGRR